MEDRLITLQKEITSDLWALRGFLYIQTTNIEKKIKRLEQMMEKTQ